jgi:hypothetical protein
MEVVPVRMEERISGWDIFSFAIRPFWITSDWYGVSVAFAVRTCYLTENWASLSVEFTIPVLP